jgi:hypothetical protein
VRPRIDLNTAINEQTAGSCVAVNYLGIAVSDPPSQAEVQAIADLLDQVLTNLRRE